jgi:hypothetical protein
VILNLIAFYNPEKYEFNNLNLLTFIPLIISILLIKFPYNIGIIILSLGIFIHATTQRIKSKTTKTISVGIILSGIILIIQSAAFYIYNLIVIHGHRIDIFSPLVSTAGNLLGLKTSVNNGIVFIQTIQQTYPFTTTWEKLGFLLWFNLLVGVFVLFLILYEKRNILYSTLVFFLLSIPYLIIRYIAYIHLFIHTSELKIFWNPWYMFFSFFPLILIFIKILPFTKIKIEINIFKNFNITKKHIIAFILIFICIFSIVGSISFYDPGKQKPGRILIDEFHSDWEDSIKPLDKQWFGMLSTYNYYSMAEWLNYYYEVHKNNETLSLASLNDFDILILKCPTNSYSNQEIWAVLQFVENGGGLYLIGDHTDVFGMNTFLNQVSENFGIRFKTDATYELGTGMLSTHKPNDFFIHPIMQNVKQVDFMTSCTLEAPINSENVIVGSRLVSEPGTYSTENFFRESTSSPESEYGLLLQVTAVKYGKGRVVAFTDSTVFSSFSFFSDGYQDFTLGTIQYLNRINEYQYLNIVFLSIAIISFCLTLYLLRNTSKFRIILILLIIGLLSSSPSIILFNQLNKLNYPIVQAHSDYTKICFEQEYSDFNISLQPSIAIFYDDNNYGTFYVWTQRLGYVPSIENSLENAMKNGEVIVFINPVKPFDLEEINNINNYLYSGGSILVMDSIRNKRSTANDLIGNFGLWIQVNPQSQYLYSDYNSTLENFTIGNISSPFLSINGGEKVLIGHNNQTYASKVEFKNETTGETGILVVLIDSYTFSDPIMGGSFNEPDSNQLQIYNTEFHLFEKILLKYK